MIWVWVGFVAFVLMMLALDLGVFHRRGECRVRSKKRLGWSGVWVALALLFSVFVYFGYEHHWLGLGITPDVVGGQVNDGSADRCEVPDRLCGSRSP